MRVGVGLHIAPDAVRVVTLLRKGGAVQLGMFSERPVVPGEGESSEQAQARSLGEILKTRRFPRTPVAASIDSSQAIFRRLTVPFTGQDQIRKTVKFEMEPHVHKEPIEQMIVEYAPIDTNGKESHLLAVAVPKAAVRKRLELLSQAGIDPVVLEADALALYNAAAAAGIPKDAPDCLVVYFDQHVVHMLLVRKGALCLVRNLALSLPALAPEDADKPLSTEVLQLYETLCLELNRTVLLVPSERAPEKILLAGALHGHHDLDQRLSEYLAIPCERIDLGPRILRGSRELPPAAGISLGLALKALDEDAVGTDFRREEFVYERRAEPVRNALLFLALSLVALLVVIALRQHDARLSLERELATIEGHEIQIFAALFPKQKAPEAAFPASPSLPGSLARPFRAAAMPTPTRFAELATKLRGQEEELLGGGEHPLPVSALEYWKDLSSRIGRARFEFFGIDRLLIQLGTTTSRISLQGKASTAREAEEVQRQIQQHSAFRAARVGPGGIKPQPDGKVSYDFLIPLQP